MNACRHNPVKRIDERQGTGAVTLSEMTARNYVGRDHVKEAGYCRNLLHWRMSRCGLVEGKVISTLEAKSPSEILFSHDSEGNPRHSDLVSIYHVSVEFYLQTSLYLDACASSQSRTCRVSISCSYASHENDLAREIEVSGGFPVSDLVTHTVQSVYALPRNALNFLSVAAVMEIVIFSLNVQRKIAHRSNQKIGASAHGVSLCTAKGCETRSPVCRGASLDKEIRLSFVQGSTTSFDFSLDSGEHPNFGMDGTFSCVDRIDLSAPSWRHYV